MSEFTGGLTESQIAVALSYAQGVGGDLYTKTVQALAADNYPIPPEHGAALPPVGVPAPAATRRQRALG